MLNKQNSTKPTAYFVYKVKRMPKDKEREGEISGILVTVSLNIVTVHENTCLVCITFFIALLTEIL